MKRRKHTTEQITQRLREAEQLEAAGQTTAQVCQKLEVFAAALARWRKQFRGMGDAEIKWRNRPTITAAADESLLRRVPHLIGVAPRA